MLTRLFRNKRRRSLVERRAIASLEFATIAPVLLTLTLAGTDGARALLIWRQVHNAASAIAQNAEKLSVTTDPNTGIITPELTADQMQQAMSTIYAEIPGLNLGNGGGLFPGNFAVSLASVVFSPTCTQSTGCPAQTPKPVWTTYLTVGGSKLLTGKQRACGNETQVAAFPDDSTQYTVMVSPNLAPGAVQMTVPPQLVVDVQYTFTPYFPFWFKSHTYYASAMVAAPIGGVDQIVTLNTSQASPNVTSCP